MRIQSFSNTYNSVQRSNTNPQFKSNVFVRFDSFCRTRKDFCTPALEKLVQASVAAARKTEKFGDFGKFFWVFEDDKRAGCLIIDKTDKAYGDSSSLNIEPLDGDGGGGVLAFIRSVLVDSETKKLTLPTDAVKDCELCEFGAVRIFPNASRENVYMN